MLRIGWTTSKQQCLSHHLHSTSTSKLNSYEEWQLTSEHVCGFSLFSIRALGTILPWVLRLCAKILFISSQSLTSQEKSRKKFILSPLSLHLSLLENRSITRVGFVMRHGHKVWGKSEGGQFPCPNGNLKIQTYTPVFIFLNSSKLT